MGLLGGALTARRYKVVGELMEGWRTAYRDQLDAFAFREPATPVGKEELEGWVQVHNLLDTSFEDYNRWLYEPFAVFSLRVDKKALPANLFKATLEKECEKWAIAAGVTKVPGSKKKEIKEELEDQWLKRTLPRVTLTEVCWNTREGWVLVGSGADRANDRVRTRFHRTFGLELHPWSPLDAVANDATRDRLLAVGPSSLGGEA